MSFPMLTRSFFDVGEIRPVDMADFSLSGDDIVSHGVFNRLVILGSSQLGIDPLYTPTGGVFYTFAGPPDGSTNPIQLGFRGGDTILLLQCEGHVGPPGPNTGLEVTIADPSTLDIYEGLTAPDTTTYKFMATRRGI